MFLNYCAALLALLMGNFVIFDVVKHFVFKLHVLGPGN